MFGNAPTRMTVAAPWANIGSDAACIRMTRNSVPLRIFPSVGAVMGDHWNYAGFFFLLCVLSGAGKFGLGPADNVLQGSVFENSGGRGAHIQKGLIEGAVLGIAIDQAAQLIGISKRSQRAVD